mmetsp:Transcript_39670/g.113278  ORF Transcript_39670/g.113278 Transcript_39670/m.113278 type:complete len:198 (+) Transcript_39670:3-596(+)
MPAGLGMHAGLAAPGMAASGPGATQGATPEQMQEYARYVAAVQLQYAAMGSMAVAQAVGHPSALGAGAAARPAATHDSSRKFTGSVFKWDDDQGWGFISCLDARKVYGKDVFLHKAEIGGVADLYRQRTKIEVKNGDWVQFCVEISRGKPRARDVEMVDTPEEYRKPGEGAGAKKAEAKAEEGNQEPPAKKQRGQAE